MIRMYCYIKIAIHQRLLNINSIDLDTSLTQAVQLVGSRRPNVVLFIAGSNDVCDLGADPLRRNAPRLLEQLKDHYEAHSWLSREPLSWARSLSGIPAAMNHGEQSVIKVPWHCWMRANLSPVEAKYNSNYTLHKTAIRPLILFVLMWNFLFRCQNFCKNNHTFFHFSTGNVCELKSHNHHSGWATWAGHSTERARAWNSGSPISGKPISCGHQPQGDSSVMPGRSPRICCHLWTTWTLHVTFLWWCVVV